MTNPAKAIFTVALCAAFSLATDDAALNPQPISPGHSGPGDPVR
ncbi:MAG TPA: hypothetical protein VIJ37_04335 [Steroidobacteraceae bacterium]